MWKRLSLRARLFLPMIAMILVALGLGGVALRIVSPDQFEYENAEQSQSTKAVADALNAALAASNNPRQTLDAFEHGLGTLAALTFQAPGAGHASRPRIVSSTVPDWFVRLLTIPELA